MPEEVGLDGLHNRPSLIIFIEPEDRPRDGLRVHEVKVMSPRPRMFRRVHCRPDVTHFKPAGIPLRHMEEVGLTMEEFESIRLMDKEGLKQTEACERMGVSQPTFQRIYGSARKKIAQALVEGKAIRIEGGHFRFSGRACRGRSGRAWQRAAGKRDDSQTRR